MQRAKLTTGLRCALSSTRRGSAFHRSRVRSFSKIREISDSSDHSRVSRNLHAERMAMMDPRLDPDSVVNVQSEMSDLFEEAQRKRERSAHNSLRFRERIQLRGKSAKPRNLAKRRLKAWKRESRMHGENLLDLDLNAVMRRKRVWKEGQPCDGCGIPLQSKSPLEPGYIQPLPETERDSSTESMGMDQVYLPDYQKMTLMDLGLLEDESTDVLNRIKEGNDRSLKSEKKKFVIEHAVCQRCFQLKNYGRTLEQSLSKGSGSKNAGSMVAECIPAEIIRVLQRRLGDVRRRKVVILVVDIFDFNGGFIRDLPQILKNERQKNEQCKLILAVNKIDLLTGWIRKRPALLESWVRKEAARFGVTQPDAVIPICAKSGHNCRLLLKTAVQLCPLLKEVGPAQDRYRDIYVVGMTNAGKSTLINTLNRSKVIYSPRNRHLTVSSVPATTLATLAFLLPKVPNTRVVDTPGVIDTDEHGNCISLTNRLTMTELEYLQPKRRLIPLNFKLKPGQSILLGGLGRLDFDDCVPRPIDLEAMNFANVEPSPSEESGGGSSSTTPDPCYLFTIFVAQRCSVHICRSDKAEAVLNKHGGTLLKPPVGNDRMQAFLPFQRKSYTLSGIGWQHSVCDVVFPGVGWISLTGCGSISFTVHGPHNYRMGIRRPLLPRDSHKRVRGKYSGNPNKKW